jgi:hypothetical protein
MEKNVPKGRHQPPARGVLAGIKADAERAKDLNRPFDPNSVGSAWRYKADTAVSSFYVFHRLRSILKFKLLRMFWKLVV